MLKMKGVILAGGSGTRLWPNTKVTNKHLLPVYNQPMIYYPIQTLMQAGIHDILILPGKDNAGDFARLLGSGKEFNANFQFKVQDHAGGLAYAVSLAEDFVGDDNFVVIFGDNIVEDNISEDVQNFQGGAKVFLKKVEDPERFGIAELDGKRVLNIEEKPDKPKSNWCVIGMYIYDSRAFDYIRRIKPSERGELEITDLNNIYIKKGQMRAGFIKGFWFDTGTHASLVDAAHELRHLDKPREPLSLEQKESPKAVIGGVLYDEQGKDSYNIAKYLDSFFASIDKQSYQNVEVILADNSEFENNPSYEYVKKHYPHTKVIRTGRNIGFAAAYNILIKEAWKMKADYFVVSNLDMFYEANTIEVLVAAVMKTPQIASATCKIKRWDFNERKNDHGGRTNFVDSAGIAITREHRFIDRGQGDIDHGQFDSEEEIFGASGALGIFRMSALEDVAFINEDGRREYFDELMFMYKEDADLAYRLQWAGYKCLYAPEATAYHDRTIEGQGNGLLATVLNRFNKSRQAREWSWLHHHIILQKMMTRKNSLSVFFSTLWYEIKSNGYSFLMEPWLVRQWWKLFSLRKKIRARRRQIKRRINTDKHLEKLMED